MDNDGRQWRHTSTREYLVDSALFVLTCCYAMNDTIVYCLPHGHQSGRTEIDSDPVETDDGSRVYKIIDELVKIAHHAAITGKVMRRCPIGLVKG